MRHGNGGRPGAKKFVTLRSGEIRIADGVLEFNHSNVNPYIDEEIKVLIAELCSTKWGEWGLAWNGSHFLRMARFNDEQRGCFREVIWGGCSIAGLHHNLKI